jgi:hypothetical protein
MNTHSDSIHGPPIIDGPSTCKNCGHDQKDHNYDDGCWQEVRTGSQIMLCTCPGFQALASATRAEAVNSQLWYQLFRQVVVEPTQQNFSDKVAEVEQAIRQRITEVRPSDGPEWQRLRDALQTLKFMKTL